MLPLSAAFRCLLVRAEPSLDLGAPLNCAPCSSCFNLALEQHCPLRASVESDGADGVLTDWEFRSTGGFEDREIAQERSALQLFDVRLILDDELSSVSGA